jgi:release factor glutamine methyltransferase
MILKDLARHFTSVLNSIYDDEEIHALFLIAIDHVLHYSRTDYLVKKEELIEAHDLDLLQNILSELAEGHPIQYILGETVFYGLSFKVNPSVLIPRPETEELVDWIIGENSRKTGLKIIDIGTGSGCIAISVEKRLPGNIVFALDVSPAALHTAMCNASKNQSDLIFVDADIRTYKTEERFDIIVSNPPYITVDEQTDMHHNVFAHEPHLALFVSNEKPLIFYEAIADFALQSLVPGGLLYFEINEHLGKESIDMLNYKGFKNIELRIDMQGKDRMIRCVFGN